MDSHNPQNLVNPHILYNLLCFYCLYYSKKYYYYSITLIILPNYMHIIITNSCDHYYFIGFHIHFQ